MMATFTRSHAIISSCGRYRYTLTRGWSAGTAMAFVMLNPSTADAMIDDPTIRRCISFARREGHGTLHVVNLFAIRSPSPAAIIREADPVGPDNLRHIAATIDASQEVVVAWGAHPLAERQEQVVMKFITDYGHTPKCLGLTKNDHPRHPLYVRADAPLIPFPIRRDAQC